MEQWFAPDIRSVLSRTQRAVHDFWQLTQYASELIIFVRFRAVEILRDPIHIYDHEPDGYKQSIFFQMTRDSWTRLSQSETMTGHQVETVVANWLETFPIESPDRRLSIVLPTPHAVLCAGRQWETWGFPLPVKPRRRTGLQLRLGRELWRGVHVAEPVDEQHDLEFTLEHLQSLADLLRQHLRSPAGIDDVSLENQTVAEINFVQRMRDSLMQDLIHCSRRVYAMDYLLDALLLASHLRTEVVCKRRRMAHRRTANHTHAGDSSGGEELFFLA